MVNSSFNNRNSVPDPSFANLKHSSGLSLDWTPEEKAILEEGLVKYESETKLVQYYSKIANDLDNKTVRDVALRVRFMNECPYESVHSLLHEKKENSKRRKDDHNLKRKSKDKKEKVSDPAVKSSHSVARPNVSPYASATIMMDNDDGVSYQLIGGPTAELLEQNAKALSQISANLDALQLQVNIPLFCQMRNNIMKLLNDLKDVPEAMKEMPPFHFNIDEAKVNSILPKTTFPTQ